MPIGVYGPLKKHLIDDLRRTVRRRDVLLSPEDMEPYTHDEAVGLRAEPQVAVRVTSAQQVSKTLRPAQWARVPVTPSGAGYGLRGGASLLRRQSWARYLALVLSVLGLFSFPIGTAIGAYSRWALVQDETARLFGSRPIQWTVFPPAPTVAPPSTAPVCRAKAT